MASAYPYLTLFRFHHVDSGILSKLEHDLGLRQDEPFKQELMESVFPVSQMEGFKKAYSSVRWFPERGTSFPSLLLLEPDAPALALYSLGNHRFGHALEV